MMEKGKLIVAKEGSEIKVSILFSDKKPPYKASRVKLPDDSLNGGEVIVYRPKGFPERITYEGQEIYPEYKYKPATKNNYLKESTTSKNKDNRDRNSNVNQKNTSNYPPRRDNQSAKPIHREVGTEVKENKNPYLIPEGSAKAPYNFIPLQQENEIVHLTELPTQDRYHTDRLTGYIELGVETLTPVYIRDSLNKEEMKKDEELKKKNKENKFINSDFFSPYGKDKFAIPGSSMRGMIRTIVEIVSFGNFGFTDRKRKLYYRTVGERVGFGIGEKYRDYIKNRKIGIIYKHNNDYFIRPAKESTSEKWEIIKIEEEIIFPKKERGNESTIKVKENLYRIMTTELPERGKDRRNNNFYHVEDSEPNTIGMKLNDDIINDYSNDKNRGRNVPDLLKLAKERSVPCYYIEIDGDICSFGYNPFFRLAYTKRIFDHIPSYLKENPKIKYDSLEKKYTEIIDVDYANAIFGFTTEDQGEIRVLKSLKGRVEFSDCIVSNGKARVLDISIPKTLNEPKPTSFQHYLTQSNNKPKDDYDSNVNIRGNKLYWHRSDKSNIDYWRERDQEILNIINNGSDKMHTKIKPVDSDSVFKGKIYFENLSEQELGCLLFALDLPKGCHHKIGMGKPIGLGSIKIKPTLHISNRTSDKNKSGRYSSLLSEWKGISQSKKLIDEYKNDFVKHISDVIKFSSKDWLGFWDHPRLNELRTMLDWDGKPELAETEYMSLRDFKNRNILSQPKKYKMV